MSQIRLGCFVGMWLAASGCTGLLTIDAKELKHCEECGDCADKGQALVCEANVCADLGRCELGNPAGKYCLDCRTCMAGLCMNDSEIDPTDPYCNCDVPETCGCPDDEACLSATGECVPIPPEHECSTQHPDGYCKGGFVCVSGVCRGSDPSDACSASNPEGFCKLGFVCDRGSCVPLTPDISCSPTNLTGKCQWPKICVNGECVLDTQPCGPNNLHGTCPEGEECIRGICVPTPCAVNFDGWCPDAYFCSPTVGYCIPDGKCANSEDCGLGNKCSCLATYPIEDCANGAGGCPSCIWEGACECDEDCSGTADNGVRDETCTGNSCERTMLCPNGTDDECRGTEKCSTTGHCIAGNACEPGVDADCEDGEYCCSENLCTQLDIGGERGCCATADCTGELEECKEGICKTGCDNDDECPPAHTCNEETRECVPDTSLSCDSKRVNGPSRSDCPIETATDAGCCPVDAHCCDIDLGQRCSDGLEGENQPLCIQMGECLADSDCLDGPDVYHCDMTTYTCEPVTPGCGAGCGGTEYCSVDNACIPDGMCVVDRDCPNGEICNEKYECQRKSCDTDERITGPRVKPYVLILLDRSGSMNLCNGTEPEACGGPPYTENGDGCEVTDLTKPVRWDAAKAAISQITHDHVNNIFFGLSTFPHQWIGTGPCLLRGNWKSCDGLYCCQRNGAPDCWTAPATEVDTLTDAVCGENVVEEACLEDPCHWSGTTCDGDASSCANNTAAAEMDWPVGSTREDILAFLDVTYPGGATPTGKSLRAIRDNPSAAGLNVPNRENVIILVTDGAANSDTVPDAQCPSGTQLQIAACKVKEALDDLRALDPPITTYVVGFMFGEEANGDLNCFADHGGTATCALPITCARKTTQADCEAATCTWQDGACVGPLDCADTTAECYHNATSATALSNALDSIITSVAGCRYELQTPPYSEYLLFSYFQHDGEEERVNRDIDQVDGWDYDDSVGEYGQIEFFGTACDRIMSGEVTPLIVYGCCTDETC